MTEHTETGVFTKPDPSTKLSMLSEDKDTINRLKRDLSRKERNEKFLAIAVVAGVLVGGFGVWKSDTKYYMVERTPDNRKVIYVPSNRSIPAEETIQYELAEFVQNSRSVYRDNRANLENRWEALTMVQMGDDERRSLYDAAEKELDNLHKTRDVMVSSTTVTPRGGDHYTLEWIETHRDRRTGRMQSVRQVADIQAFYIEQDGKNPGGIMFSKPIESIHSEVIEIAK